MKILVISSTPWSSDNSFGNSFSNIFESIEGLEFANVYCKKGMPDNNLNMIYYQFSEKKLLKSIFKRKLETGRRVFPETDNSTDIENVKGTQIATKIRYTWMLWIRDLIWKFGNWKTDGLKQFIDDFSPDIIFQPIYFSTYLNEMALFAKKYTGKKMIGYISDDNYTLRQFSLSPLYWIDRLIKRRYVRKAIDNCELLYVISDIQKKEYEKIFNKECKVLTKCADFSEKADVKKEYSRPLKLVYTGNLGAGRWKSISLISQAVERINKDENLLSFDIYSATQLTNRMRKSLNHKGTVFNGSVPSSEIEGIQKDADILVHAEGMDLKSRLQVHQSFSTKIVDYLKAARTILAVGTEDEASIDYFLKNECAVVCSDANAVYYDLLNLINDNNLLTDFATKAYYRGQFNHSSEKIKTMLVNDLKRFSDND